MKERGGKGKRRQVRKRGEKEERSGERKKGGREGLKAVMELEIKSKGREEECNKGRNEGRRGQG